MNIIISNKNASNLLPLSNTSSEVGMHKCIVFHAIAYFSSFLATLLALVFFFIIFILFVVNVLYTYSKLVVFRISFMINCVNDCLHV